jgi:hypothetical protein
MNRHYRVVSLGAVSYYYTLPEVSVDTFFLLFQIPINELSVSENFIFEVILPPARKNA